MSQKLGFPFLGFKITVLVFFIGLLLSVLTLLTMGLLILGYAIPLILIAFLRFLGVFLTGWALIGFSVMKELLPKQRLIAFIFAIMLLSVLFFASKVLVFSFEVT